MKDIDLRKQLEEVCREYHKYHTRTGHRPHTVVTKDGEGYVVQVCAPSFVHFLLAEEEGKKLVQAHHSLEGVRHGATNIYTYLDLCLHPHKFLFDKDNRIRLTAGGLIKGGVF